MATPGVSPFGQLLSAMIIAMPALGQATDAEGGAGTSTVDVILEIGALEEPVEEAFGQIVDVEVDSKGWVYVLDGRFSEVRAFDEEGTYGGTAGQPGRGPGELLVPEAMAILEDTVLAVLDQGNLRLSYFGLMDVGFDFRGSARLPFPAFDLCTADGRIFVMGHHGGSVVHELSADGELVGSFHASSAPGDDAPPRFRPFLRASFSDGQLLCDAGEGIMVQHRHLPTVSSYTLDGRLRWRTDLGDFHEMEIRQTAEGLMQYAPGPEGVTHHGVGLSGFPEELAVVQLAREDHSRRMKRVAPEPVRSIETRMLGLASGEEVTTRSDLPLVLATRARRLYAVRTDPYPVLAILRVRDRGGPEQ